MINDWQWLESLLVGIFKLVEQSYNQELLVIPGYKGLKSLDRLDGNENSMFRRPLGLLEEKFNHQHS